jgi:hypothetical protein
MLVRFRSVCQRHRKRESQLNVSGCKTWRSRLSYWLHLARHTTADRMVSQRKSDRWRVYLCGAGLRKHASDKIIIFRQLRCIPQLSDLQPIRSPFGLLPQTALDLDVHKALALVGVRIFSRPRLICSRSCDFRIDHQLVIRSFRHTRTASMDHASDWRVKSMGA